MAAAARPRLIPFKAEHLMTFLNRDGTPHCSWRDAQEKERDIAFTGVFEDRFIGCAGIIIPWKGFGLAWATLSEDIKPHMVWLTRVVRNVIRDSINAYGLVRIEMNALASVERNLGWPRVLGFTREQHGLARRYNPDGNDVVRFEWVKNG